MKSAKVVVITGASAGVGRATVREFAKRGANIALIARGVDGLQAAKKEVEQYGGRGLVLPLDVADPAAIEKATDEIENTLGPIDIWINNAMNSVFAPIAQMTAEEYKRVTEVTYLGQVYGTLSVLKRMRERDRGCIIFVGSALAYRGIPLQSAYCAAKHAVEGFYDSLRCELLHDKSNIQTCMVQLPALNTTQFGFVRNKQAKKPRPMGKIFQPEVAAEAIVFASEHKRRELFVGLPTVEAIIGNKFVPEVGDYYLAKTAYEGQFTNEPADPDHHDNLYVPLPGDHGAHGPFGAQAHSFSPQFWLSKNRSVVAGCLTMFLLGTALLLKR